MTNDIMVYDLLISCPSDVSQYVELLERQIHLFNNFYGRSKNIIVRSRYWEKDSYSKLGIHPQELLKEQILSSTDILLSVFWTRLGTPVCNSESGTEDEIKYMLENKKQVLLFFLEKPIKPSEIDQNQYQRLHVFKEKYENKGIVFTLDDEIALGEKVKENLMLYFDSIVDSEKPKKNKAVKEILWVDDRPENNVYERIILENYGLTISLALSTQQALRDIHYQKFDLIISDMGRKEGPDEGYKLLEEIRRRDIQIPFIIYAGSSIKEHVDMAIEHGAQGCTNNPMELFELVIKNLL